MINSHLHFLSANSATWTIRSGEQLMSWVCNQQTNSKIATDTCAHTITLVLQEGMRKRWANKRGWIQKPKRGRQVDTRGLYLRLHILLKTEHWVPGWCERSRDFAHTWWSSLSFPLLLSRLHYNYTPWFASGASRKSPSRVHPYLKTSMIHSIPTSGW